MIDFRPTADAVAVVDETGDVLAVVSAEVAAAIEEMTARAGTEDADWSVLRAAGEIIAGLRAQLRWIPVGEELPPRRGHGSESADVIVTAEYGGIRSTEMDRLDFAAGCWTNFGGDGWQVLAWKPKPQPWRGDAPVTAQEGDSGVIGGEEGSSSGGGS